MASSIAGVVGVTIALWSAVASAQRPLAPDSWRYGKRQDASALHYCVDPRDADFKVAAAIGEAIAGALLLQPKPHVVENALALQELEELYGFFLNNCDVYLGFKLISGAYPDWMVVSRAYYTAEYVYVTRNENLTALADVPPGGAISTTLGTMADLRLVNYLRALDPAKRWSRIPVASNDVALDDVKSGDVSASLVWRPSLWSLQQSDPAAANLKVIAPRPLPATTLGVGAALLVEETFLRNAVDRAIAALGADGTIRRILDRFKFPATVE